MRGAIIPVPAYSFYRCCCWWQYNANCKALFCSKKFSPASSRELSLKRWTLKGRLLSQHRCRSLCRLCCRSSRAFWSTPTIVFRILCVVLVQYLYLLFDFGVVVMNSQKLMRSVEHAHILDPSFLKVRLFWLKLHYRTFLIQLIRIHFRQRKAHTSHHSKYSSMNIFYMLTQLVFMLSSSYCSQFLGGNRTQKVIQDQLSRLIVKIFGVRYSAALFIWALYSKSRLTNIYSSTNHHHELLAFQYIHSLE